MTEHVLKLQQEQLRVVRLSTTQGKRQLADAQPRLYLPPPPRKEPITATRSRTIEQAEDENYDPYAASYVLEDERNKTLYRGELNERESFAHFVIELHPDSSLKLYACDYMQVQPLLNSRSAANTAEEVAGKRKAEQYAMQNSSVGRAIDQQERRSVPPPGSSSTSSGTSDDLLRTFMEAEESEVLDTTSYLFEDRSKVQARRQAMQMRLEDGGGDFNAVCDDDEVAVEPTGPVDGAVQRRAMQQTFSALTSGSVGDVEDEALMMGRGAVTRWTERKAPTTAATPTSSSKPSSSSSGTARAGADSDYDEDESGSDTSLSELDEEEAAVLKQRVAARRGVKRGRDGPSAGNNTEGARAKRGRTDYRGMATRYMQSRGGQIPAEQFADMLEKHFNISSNQDPRLSVVMAAVKAVCEKVKINGKHYIKLRNKPR